MPELDKEPATNVPASGDAEAVEDWDPEGELVDDPVVGFGNGADDTWGVGAAERAADCEAGAAGPGCGVPRSVSATCGPKA
ncbi:hypothetical protein, partial [Segeticoccus rhizosphaerae]|uniref:hypothetical protein n=1 Tax=Segeticoccus rhizosphaerae TaxID=1104777 RepID=UPI001396766A